MAVGITSEAGQFAMVPFWLIEEVGTGNLKPSSLHIYCTLLLYANQHRSCWPSKETIIEKSGLSHNTFGQAIKELEDVGAVVVQQRHGTSNLYFLPMIRGYQNLVPLPESGRGGSQNLGGVGVPKSGPLTRTNGTRTNELDISLLDEFLVPDDQKTLVRSKSSDELFDTFWSLAVKKVDKGRAKVAWLHATKVTPQDVVLAAWAEHNRRWATWHDSERQYIKHPTTWLNGCCWEDEVLPEMFKGRSALAVAEEVMTHVTQDMTEDEERRFMFPEMYAAPDRDMYKSDIAAINGAVDPNEEER